MKVLKNLRALKDRSTISCWMRRFIESRGLWQIGLEREIKTQSSFTQKPHLEREKNKIRGIEDEHGKWIEEIEEVIKQFCEYFAYLFSTSNPSRD